LKKRKDKPKTAKEINSGIRTRIKNLKVHGILATTIADDLAERGKISISGQLYSRVNFWNAVRSKSSVDDNVEEILVEYEETYLIKK
jgi:hypothetical protein